MKKNILKIMIFTLICMLFMDNVNAKECTGSTCSYGLYFSDELGYWDAAKQQLDTFNDSNYTWFNNLYSFDIVEDSTGVKKPVLNNTVDHMSGSDLFDEIIEPFFFRSEDGTIGSWELEDFVGNGSVFGVLFSDYVKFKTMKTALSLIPRINVTYNYSDVISYYTNYNTMPQYIYYNVEISNVLADSDWSTENSSKWVNPLGINFWNWTLFDDFVETLSNGETDLTIRITYRVNDFDAMNTGGFVIALDKDVDLSICYGYEILVDNLEKYGKEHGYGTNFISFSTDIQEKCDKYIIKYGSTGCAIACNGLKDRVSEIAGVDISSHSCKSLGPQMVGWLVKILKIVRYILPVLAIILSVMDFISAIASSDDDALKKAGTRFVKRIIAVVIIFLLPAILQFLFDTFKIKGLESGNPYCLK